MTPGIASYIRTIPDYPEPGILFRDVTPLLEDARGLRMTVDLIVHHYIHRPIDVVVGIEARGFIFGPAVAYGLGLGFVPIRKAGKLPGEVVSAEYELEYGTDRMEMHADAIEEGASALLIDDLIATGGTATAALQLVERVGGQVRDAAFVVDLPELGGAAKLKARGCSVFTLCEFAGG
ncbi:MAG: adenine phosphoribosyltransferase [Longimicrobiales bacterium]|nr:adenine phosphoribosyltransferase [Longimicrobiales bacterium]